MRTDGVYIPVYVATDDGNRQSKCIDNDAVAVIDEEDVHSGIAAENEAVNT
jgi:hypothetical protein